MAPLTGPLINALRLGRASPREAGAQESRLSPTSTRRPDDSIGSTTGRVTINTEPYTPSRVQPLSLQQPPSTPTVSWPRLLPNPEREESRSRRASRERGVSVLDHEPAETEVMSGSGGAVQAEPEVEDLLTQSGLIAEIKLSHHGWRRIDERYLKPFFGGHKRDDDDSEDDDD